MFREGAVTFGRDNYSVITGQPERFRTGCTY
jgi:hypothetical protein